MKLIVKNRYFYSIEEDRGGKYVHIFSNMIYNDVYELHEDNMFCGMVIPVKYLELLSGRDIRNFIESLCCEYKYIDIIKNEDLASRLNNYFQGTPGKCLNFNDITDDIPCGDYFCDIEI